MYSTQGVDAGRKKDFLPAGFLAEAHVRGKKTSPGGEVFFLNEMATLTGRVPCGRRLRRTRYRHVLRSGKWIAAEAGESLVRTMPITASDATQGSPAEAARCVLAVRVA